MRLTKFTGTSTTYLLEFKNGTDVILTPDRLRALYIMILRELLWDEVVFRYAERPEWKDILAAKEGIITDLEYQNDFRNHDDVISDEIADAIEWRKPMKDKKED